MQTLYPLVNNHEFYSVLSCLIALIKQVNLLCFAVPIILVQNKLMISTTNTPCIKKRVPSWTSRVQQELNETDDRTYYINSVVYNEVYLLQIRVVKKCLEDEGKTQWRTQGFHPRVAKLTTRALNKPLQTCSIKAQLI